RIADGEIGGAMAHGTARPGNRHQAQRAVELREVQLDPGGAIGRYLEGPGEEGDRFLGRGTADEPAARGAATAPETACFPQRALYEAAVEVAHFHGKGTLAEIPGLGVGRLVGRKVQDADVHS